MGAFSKMLGLKGKAELRVETEKPYYVVGETIRGSVSMKVLEPFDCQSVVVRLKGKLSMHHTYDARTHFYETHKLCDQVNVVTNFAETLYPGDYSYPFEMKLEGDLPGSTKYHTWDVDHSVKYRLESTVSVNDTYCKDLKFKKELTVYEDKSSCPAPEPITVTETRDAKILFAISRGELKITGKLAKNVFTPDEVAEVEFTVENNSGMDIPKIRVRLMRQFDFQFKLGKRHPAHCAHKIELPGVGKHETVTHTVPVPLTFCAEARPSHHPKASLDYDIKIENKISMGKDPKLKMRIHILPEEPASSVQPSFKNMAMDMGASATSTSIPLAVPMDVSKETKSA